MSELRDPARWRQRQGEGGGGVVEFDRRGGGTGWEVWFHIRISPVSGRGLYAARQFAHKEAMVVYMGRDLGGEGTQEGTRAREALAAVHRADHIMVVSGRYIDGRHGVTGAQYVNAARGTSGRTDNARFGATGTITVEKRSGIAAGEEILMAYGQDYWRQRDAEARRVKRDERVGGFAAYSKHDGGRVIFIEEVVCAPTARGRQLGVGRQLFRRIVGAAGRNPEEVHLVVARDNVHAKNLYGSLGFTPCSTGRVHAMGRESTDEYWAAQAAALGARLGSDAAGSDDGSAWEQEVAESAGHLRPEDRAWATQMYNDAHGSDGQRRTWARDHAQGATHVVLWRGDVLGACRTVAAAHSGDVVLQTHAYGANTGAASGRARDASADDTTAEDAARAQGACVVVDAQQRAASSGRRTDGDPAHVAVGDGDVTRSDGAGDSQQQRCEAHAVSASVSSPSKAAAWHGMRPEAAVQATLHKGQQSNERNDGDGDRIESRGGTHAGDGAALRGAAAGHAVRTSPVQQRPNLKRATSSEGRTDGTKKESAIVVGDGDVTRDAGQDGPTKRRCAVSTGSMGAQSAAVRQQQNVQLGAAVQAAQHSERQQVGRSGGSSTPGECNGGGREGEDAAPTGTAGRAERTAVEAQAQCTWAPAETSLPQGELADGPSQTSGARGRGKKRGGSEEDISEEEYGRGVKKKRQACTLPSPP